MLIEILRALFKRDLDKLVKEIQAYHDEKNLWVTEEGIANSAGNLCLHLVGNLNHFFGAIIAKTGYVRNRELEFSDKDVPAEDLIRGITEAAGVVDETLAGITEDELEKEYPVMVFDYKMTTGYFLVHLATHLSYHLGQINYHRRLLDVKS